MKRLLEFFLCVILAVLTLPAVAGHHEVDCKAGGSWFGYDEQGSIWWTSTVDGQSASHGTLNLEVPGSVNFFDGAFAISELKGQWEKTGGNTYDWTVVGIPFDEYAASLLIVKLSGSNILDEDCDMMMVTNLVMEVFPPVADIYADDPAAVDTSFPDHPGYRVKVDLPELLP
jgi:hypothetical protein